MNVTLPNGKVIKGVPEGTSKDAIRQKAIDAGLATESDFGATGQRQAGPDMQQVRQQAMQETASEVGPLEAFLIGTGKGFMDIGRGVGLVDDESEADAQAMEALREQRPYTTGAGEITGQAAPFVPLGIGAGAIRSMGGRVLAGGGLGAAEGGIIASGTDKDVVQGAGVGGAIGAGAEVLFPVLGRLGRSVYRRVKGTPPKGAMLDAAGRPTAELQDALDEAGLTMDDLVVDAQEVIRGAKPGSDPSQVVRSAQFAQEGIPLSRGTMTKKMADEATEEQLLKSTLDPNAEPFRQFKLKQSQTIRDTLERNLNTDQMTEETGSAIKDALTTRKNLLRTQKNDLYREALDAVDSADAIPIMANVSDAIPDARTLRGLDRASGGKATDVVETLAEYGLTDPTPRQLADDAFAPSVLTLQDAEELQQILKGIARNDPSNATQGIVARATQAIDEEVANIAENATDLNLSDDVIKPLRKARETVRQLKTEFDPKALSGQLVDNLKGSEVPRLAPSKVYNKLVSKASPVEGIRSTVANLRRAGPEGEQALAQLQTTTMLDLIEAGFGTASRQVDGIRTFNPNAFRKRLQNIGDDKIEAIFSTNPSTLQRLRNIDKISESLIPSADAVPKGSAPVLQDLFNRLGLATISAKVPGAGLVVDKLAEIGQNYGTRQQVKQAMRADPDLAQVAYRIDQEFPGIAAALGIAGVSVTDQESEEDDTNPNQ